MRAHYDVVMLALNDVTHDSRVRREAAALTEAGRRVLVVGTQRADGTLSEREQVGSFELWRVRYGRWGAGLWRPWRWVRHALQAAQIVWTLRKVHTRAYHAHDLPTLPLMLAARVLWGRGARLVYDAHELYAFMPSAAGERVREADGCRASQLSLGGRALFALEGVLARRADAVLTVSAPMARALRLWHGWGRVIVVRNAVDPPHTSAPRDLRALVDGRRCIVHTGNLSLRGRCLVELVQALARLPDDVALIFLGQGEARTALEGEATRLGVTARVHFVPPVPPEAVAATVQVCDVAAVLLCPESWHIRSTLPNKLFEAIAAGVPVLASDIFALRRIVGRYELGALCNPRDPNAVAAALQQLLGDLPRYRANVQAAQARFNWAREAEKLRALYRELLP